jgi:putative membrane protein
MEQIKTIFYGLIIGISNVIPGVSGGTMAVVFGIYEKLIAVVSLDIKAIKENLLFITLLGVGIIGGILGFSNIMNFLLLEYSTLTFYSFLGIILGSFPLIIKKAGIKKVRTSEIIAFLFTFSLMMLLTFAQPDGAGQIDISQLTLFLAIGLFAASAISTFTMILPGISGSMVLLAVGMYQGVFGYAIGQFVFPHLLIVVLGMLTGLIFGAKIVKVLMEKFYTQTYAAIIGLLVGSLIPLFPGFVADIRAWLLLIGFALFILWFNQLNGEK